MKSLYKQAFTINEDINEPGYDYQSTNIFRKTMSPHMFQNTILIEFLNDISKIMVNNIESVKSIRIHNNFATDKDNTNIN